MEKPLSFLNTKGSNIATNNANPLSYLTSESFKTRKNIGNPLLYTAGNIGIGISGVIEGAMDLVEGTIASITGHNEYAKSVFSNSEVGEWKKSLDESYKPGKVMSFVGDVGQGIGQSSAFLIPGAGAPLFFGGVIGQGIGGAVQTTGELGAKEYIYGALTGTAEGLLEKYVGAGGQLLGNITGKIGGSVTKKVVSALASKTASQAVWKGVAKSMLTAGAGEFAEEFLGDYIDTFLLKAIGVDENAEYSAARAAYSGLVGFVSGAAMGGVTKGINAQVMYNSGSKVVQNGNAETLVKQAKFVADGFQTKDSSKLPEALKALKESVAQYEGSADKSSATAAIKLGEIKAYMAMTEVYSGVQEVLSKLDSAADVTAYAKYMTDFTGKTYTAEDFKANKDNIKTNYASQAWATLFLKDSKAEIASKKFNDIIAADIEGKTVGKPVAQDIASAEWNGEEAVYSLDDGNYLNVMQGDDGTYSISEGKSADEVRGFTGKTMEQTKEILTKIRQATAEQRNAMAQSSVTAVDLPQGTMMNSEVNTPISGEQATDTLKQGFTASLANYTAQEQDSARKAVKNFDTLSPDSRSAIMEWVKSAKGVNKEVVSAVSFIMSVRPGLQVIYSQLGEGHKGLYANLTDIDRRLIVTSGDANAVRETIAHELTHDLRQSQGWEKLKQAALSIVGDEEKGKIIELYTSTLGISAESAEEEVVAKTVGKMLSEKTFLERYAQKNKIRRIAQTLKNLAIFFKSKGADRVVLTESYKLMQMMDGIIKRDYVRGATIEGDGIKYSLREESPPKKTQMVYKLMRLVDGKLYPLFVDAANPIGVGKWYNADSPNLDFLKSMPSGVYLVDTDNGTYQSLADYSKEHGKKLSKYPSKADVNKATEEGKRWVYIEDTAKGQRRFGGETRKYWNIGINGSGSVSNFSMRPGWHAGSLPSMRQIGKGPDGNLRDDTFVWTVGDVSADIDYQPEANSNPDKDIPTHIPVDGYYLKATNADKAKSQADVIGWYVAGAFKVVRIIGDAEARQVINDWNVAHPEAQAEYDYDRVSGMDFDAKQMKLIPKRTDIKYNLDDIKNKYADKTDAISVYESGRSNLITLSSIRVKKELRKQNIGTQFMKDLTKYSDSVNKTIVLTPSTAYGATSVNRLKEFYKRFGFVENKGKYTDFTISDSMYRTPNRSDIRYDLDEKDKDDIPEQKKTPLKGKGTLESGEVSVIKNKAQKTQDKVFDYIRVEKTIKGIANLYGVGFESERSAADRVYEVFNTFNGEPQKMIRDLSEYLVHTEQWVYNKNYNFDNTEQLIDSIEKKLTAVYEGFGKITKLGEAKQEFAKQKESLQKQKEEVREQLNTVIDDLQEKIGKINKANASTIRIMNDIERVRRIKKQRTSGALGNAEYNGLIKTAARIFSKYSLNSTMARQYARDFVTLIKKYAPEAVNEIAYNNAVNSGENELLTYLSPDLYEILTKIADGEGALNADDMNGLHVALSTMLAMDNRVDKIYYEGRWVETKDFSKTSMDGVHEQYKGEVSGAIKNETKKIMKFIVENSIDPEDAVRNVEGLLSKKVLSKGIHAIKLGVEKADAAYYQFIEGSEQFIKENKEFWKSYNEDTVTLTVTRVDFNGTQFKQEYTLTKGEAFQLYMTSKREQAKLALAMGNIKIRNSDRNGEQFKARIIKAIDKKAYASLTDEQFNELSEKMFNNMLSGIKQMESEFSTEDKAFIKLMENFYNGASKENKAKIDDLLYGKTNVIDTYYVPIVRSEMGRDVNLIQPRIDTMTVGSYSFNKDTVMGARNQLIIGDAYSIFKQHAMQLAKYVHLTIPLQNLQRIYNYRAEDSTADVYSVREYINTYVWDGFDEYLKNFYQDVQGTRGKTDLVNRKLRMVKGNYAKFAIGANIGSLFKQFASSIMMMTEVDMDSWTKGGHILNKDLVDKYSVSAANRNNPHAQYYAQGATGKLGKIGEAMMWHMKLGDRQACLTMWTMIQHDVEKKYGLALDSEENLKKSGELLDDAILAIQDTGSAATKSGMARSPNEVINAFTMFRSATIKMLSKVYIASAETAEVLKRKKAGEDVSEEMVDKAKKRLATVAGAVTVAALFEATISVLMNKLRGRYDKEEEEKLIEKIATESALNLVGLVPVAGQLIENWAGGYDTSLFYYDILNDGKNAINGVFKNGSKVISGEYVDTADVARSVRDLIYFLGTITGIPTRNVNNFATMALRTVSVESAYKYGAVFTDTGMTATLNSAISKGNDKLAEAVISNLYSEKTGKTDAELSNIISELYAQGYNVLPTNVPTSYKVGEEAKTVTAEEHKTMKGIYSQATEELRKIVVGEKFNSLEPEAKARVISLTYSAYLNKAKHETLDINPSKVALLMDYTDIETLMIALGYISTLEGENKSEEVKEYIRKYDKNTQAIILYSAGYSTKDIRDTVKKIVNKDNKNVDSKILKLLGL